MSAGVLVPFSKVSSYPSGIFIIFIHMSRKYKFYDNEAQYFISFAVINWIDLFVRDIYREVLVESVRYCQLNKDLQLYAWCIMTSHDHMIIGSRGNNLSNIVRDLKRHTSEKLRAEIRMNPTESRREWILSMMEHAGSDNGNNRGFQLWQQHNHPIILDTDKILHQKLDYIHNNPVEAGFVELAEEWLYSSARDYLTERRGILEVIKVDPILVVVE